MTDISAKKKEKDRKWRKIPRFPRRIGTSDASHFRKVFRKIPEGLLHIAHISQSNPVTTSTTGGGVLFSSLCPFLQNWPILTYLGFFVVNLRTFWCTFYRPEKFGGVPKMTR